MSKILPKTRKGESVSEHDTPQGYVTSAEAAERMGRSQQNIRDRINAGTLDGMKLDTSLGSRYYVRQEAVAHEEARRGELATRKDTGEVMVNQRDLFEQLVKLLGALDAGIALNREVVSGAVEHQEQNLLEEMRKQGQARAGQFDQIKHNQDRLIEQIAEAAQIMREAADREKAYQERVTQIMERQSRPWWRRWLGLD